MAAFATLGELKRHLNKQSNADDDELQDILDAATEVVASLVGTTFDAGAVTERVTATGGTVLLSRRPVVGPVLLDGVEVAEDQIDRAAGLLHGVYTSVASYWRPSSSVTYATDGAVPASVMLATLIIAAHLWETQRGASISPVSQDAGMGDTSFSGAGFAIPNRARELLEPFASSSQVA